MTMDHLGIIASLRGIFVDDQVLFFVYLLLNVVDVVGKILCERKTGKRQENLLERSIIRKLVGWLIVVVAYAIGLVGIFVGDNLGINLSATSAVGWVTMVVLIVNDMRSFFQSVYDMGYKVPKTITKVLFLINKSIESTGLIEEDTNDDLERFDKKDK